MRQKEIDKEVKGPIISLVDSIFREGIEKGASDIHMEPRKDTITVRYRIYGVLNIFSTLPKSLYEVIATRIKVMANMDITNKYTWISWVSASSGIRRYMPVEDRLTGENWGYFA